MKVTKEMVERLAELAKLEFTDEEKLEFIGDFNKILAFIEKLNEVDTEGVDPLVYITDNKNITREDVLKTEITKEEGLKNAPLHDSDYIKVPKVLKK